MSDGSTKSNSNADISLKDVTANSSRTYEIQADISSRKEAANNMLEFSKSLGDSLRGSISRFLLSFSSSLEKSLSALTQTIVSNNQSLMNIIQNQGPRQSKIPTIW